MTLHVGFRRLFQKSCFQICMGLSRLPVNSQLLALLQFLIVCFVVLLILSLGCFHSVKIFRSHMLHSRPEFVFFFFFCCRVNWVFPCATWKLIPCRVGSYKPSLNSLNVVAILGSQFVFHAQTTRTRSLLSMHSLCIILRQQKMISPVIISMQERTWNSHFLILNFHSLCFLVCMFCFEWSSTF